MEDHMVYTTNEEDQAAVAALEKRISETNQLRRNNSTIGSSSSFTAVPNVAIAPGAHKYVLISANEPTENSYDSIYFVTSKKGAHYHRNAAEPYVNLLQERGYNNIQVLGGGRIYMNPKEKKIEIFGYSYGFGRADHMISKKIIEADERYQDWNVTWSNDGY